MWVVDAGFKFYWEVWSTSKRSFQQRQLTNLVTEKSPRHEQWPVLWKYFYLRYMHLATHFTCEVFFAQKLLFSRTVRRFESSEGRFTRGLGLSKSLKPEFSSCTKALPFHGINIWPPRPHSTCITAPGALWSPVQNKYCNCAKICNVGATLPSTVQHAFQSVLHIWNRVPWKRGRTGVTVQLSYILREMGTH